MKEIKQSAGEVQKYFIEYYERIIKELLSKIPEKTSAKKNIESVKNKKDITIKINDHKMSKKGIAKGENYVVKFGPSFVDGHLWIEDLSKINLFDKKEVLKTLKELKEKYEKRYKKLDKYIEELKDLIIVHRTLDSL